MGPVITMNVDEAHEIYGRIPPTSAKNALERHLISNTCAVLINTGTIFSTQVQSNQATTSPGQCVTVF